MSWAAACADAAAQFVGHAAEIFCLMSTHPACLLSQHHLEHLKQQQQQQQQHQQYQQ
jgi:hypothetical protein